MTVCELCEHNDATQVRWLRSSDPVRELDLCLPCALVLDGDADVDTDGGDIDDDDDEDINDEGW